MTDKQALRTSAIAESDPLGQKPRFGLFSQPISTAVGDDGPYKTKLHPRAEDGKGKPITQPKNLYSGPCRSGQLKKSFFGDLQSLAASGVKDEYIDPGRRLLIEQNQRLKSTHKNQNTYKPASGTGSDILWKPSYPYMEQKKPELDPKRNRDMDGKVKTNPRNTFTNPGSKIIDTYFKHEKHIEDPYNRAHELQLERKRKQKSLEPEARFKPNSFHTGVFSKAAKVYGEDVELKQKQQKQPELNIYKHESKWKGSSPNKNGLYGYLAPFPPYMENPPREIKRRISQEKKDSFKSMNSTLTTPTPSITTNPTNVRKYLSSSFSSHKY